MSIDRREYKKNWYHANKEKANEYQNRSRAKLGRKKQKQYPKPRPPVVLTPEQKLERNAYMREYQANRKRNDPHYKLLVNLRGRLYQAVKTGAKTGSAVADLGCSIEDFKLFIESKFTEGMSWNNYGEWHLDHIKPLGRFDLTDREQFLQACHFTNYQPLWALDNLKKHMKLVSQE